MKKQTLLSLLALMLISVTGFAQSGPLLTCPPNMTVNNDPGVCGAVVNYPTPTVVDAD